MDNIHNIVLSKRKRTKENTKFSSISSVYMQNKFHKRYAFNSFYKKFNRAFNLIGTKVLKKIIRILVYSSNQKLSRKVRVPFKTLARIGSKIWFLFQRK